jgi:hypothetical protein
MGYGMGAGDALLLGFGVVYSIAYACATNLLVLRPLLVPMASPIVLALVITAVWLAQPHEVARDMGHRPSTLVSAGSHL